MSDLETSGPEDTTCPDRWTLRSGEDWQVDLGTPVEMLVRSAIGAQAQIGLTLTDAKALRDQLDQHITNATPAHAPKTREEQPMWQGDREYRQAQWDHSRTPERYGGGLG